jgi:NADH dehydrogenase
MKTRIVIAGGGFAGLYSAMYFDKTLARCAEVDVTLISRENYILFTPLLHEVAAGDLYPSDIVNPLRSILRHVKVVEADVQAIDLGARRLRCVAGVRRMQREFQYDHLLLALGSETNFFDSAGVRDWAFTMKNISDAALLRNHMVALLEEAILETDDTVRRQMLTFVTAGGGFSGVETTGAVNDFVRETARHYPSVAEESIRVVLVHAGEFLLPELGEDLGRYAQRKLRKRKVEVIKGVLVSDYDGSMVRLNDGTSVPAATLIWTAGAKPNPIIASLPCAKERGHVCVNEYLQVPGVNGLWAAGDCAAVPEIKTGNFCPPTAQHGLREGLVAAQNIERTIRGQEPKIFRYTTMGLLASIGHRTGVAKVFGIKFSGFVAWCFWRTVYLTKLPRRAKRLRVMAAWALDLLFGREIEQIVTLRDVEELSGRLAHLRDNRRLTVASGHD